MNLQEKELARILFQNKVYKADGQKFEDLFTSIMSYADSGFRKIKPWGKIGDRKNDGYIESKGIFYQVYAPEDIRTKYPEVIKKLNTDFTGLLQQWSSVNEFYFVVNDKYKGINPDSEQAIIALKTTHNLEKSGFITADNLEKTLFELDDDQILAITGFLPNIEQVISLDYDILSEVIGYIMKQPIIPITGKLVVPDWDKKITHNRLGEHSEALLNHCSHTLGALQNYLNTQSTLKQNLQKQITGVYQQIKEDWQGLEITGDNIFWEMINQCSPKAENPYQMAVITIMADYFESCDIFEEPPETNE